MRVAMYYRNDDVRIEEQPTPAIGPGEVLMRIEASGICGSDTMEWYRIHRAPLVLGHEVAGVVETVGDGVEAFEPGDRIVASHHVPCNTCRYCRNGHHTSCKTLQSTTFYPGGFAEFVRLPAINVSRGVYPIPDSLSFEQASFAEPLACVLRGQNIAGVEPGASVLVIGSGLSGILHIALAKTRGARRIIATDLQPYRLEAAARFGAKVTLEAGAELQKRLRAANDGRLADLVIVTVGAKAPMEEALHCVERGGTVLFFAPTSPGKTIALPFNDIMWGRDITITTTYAGAPDDHFTALELIRAGRVPVEEMITHRLPLAETGEGFKMVAAAEDSLKIIVEPQR